MERISSRQNPIVARFRELATRRAKDRSDVLLDGEHLVAEALGSGIPVEVVAFSSDTSSRLGELAARAAASGARTLVVTDQVLDAISPVRQPSGVVAIARSGPVGLQDALGRAPQLALIVDGVQDPGNVGAIVRAAEACGATALVTGSRTADPFGWKALRGSMGSAFRLPIAARQTPAAAVAASRSAGLRIVASVPHGGRPLPGYDFRRPVAVLLGGEGSGLPPELIEAADDQLSIPMHPPVESLNVAVAAGIILYEAARQRAHRAARTNHVAVR